MNLSRITTEMSILSHRFYPCNRLDRQPLSWWCRINVRNENFIDLVYADDAVLFKENPWTWTTNLQKFLDEAATMELRTFWVETKTQNVGFWIAPAPITIAGQTVDVNDKFTYLGRTSPPAATAVQTYVGGWASSHSQWDSSTESEEIGGPSHWQRYAFTLHAFFRCYFVGPKPGHY